MYVPLVQVILLRARDLDPKGELLVIVFHLLLTAVCEEEKEQGTALAELLPPEIMCGLYI